MTSSCLHVSFNLSSMLLSGAPTSVSFTTSFVSVVFA